MYLYLLEFTYAVETREAIEKWLTEADLRGVLISTQRYDDEIFAVLASTQAMSEDYKKLSVYTAVSSCQVKRRALYRITTKIDPRVLFHSYPLGEGDEWYEGGESSIYLSMTSHKLGHRQVTWLAVSTEIVKWEDMFALRPLPASAGTRSAGVG